MGKTIIPRSEIPPACDERFAPIASDIYLSWRRLGIARSGISRLVPGYHMANPDARQLMLILTTAGSGYAFNQQDEWTLQPGTLFMSGPGLPIAFGSNDEGWQIYWWYCEPHLQSAITYYYQTCPQAAILSAAMESLFSEVGDVPRHREWSVGVDIPHKERAVMLSELIAAYLAEFIDTSPQQALNTQEQQLLVLWREVDRNLHKDWAIQHLASFLNISTASAQRWMRKYYGKSCHQLLIERRMHRATQLLQHTDYTLENIAGQLGYGDPFTFSNAFKKYAGISPSGYRGTV